MPFNTLIDAALKGVKRSQELRKERQFEYGHWMDEVDSELEVFLRRTKQVDPTNRDDQNEFYKYINKLEDRLGELRDRSATAEAPAKAIIELDNLIDILNKTSRGGVFYTSMNPSDEEIARNEEKRAEWVREDVKKVVKQLEHFAETLNSEMNEY